MPGAARAGQPAHQRGGRAARRGVPRRSRRGDTALRAGCAAVGGRRHPGDGQGQPVPGRPADDLRHRGAARPSPGARRAGRGARARGRHADPRQDQRARVRKRRLHGQPAVRRHRQPVGTAAHAGRFERRRGRRGRRRHCAAGHRAGRWRVDPAAGFAHRARRAQAVALGVAARAHAAGAAARLRRHRARGAHGRRCAAAVRCAARAGGRRPLVARRGLGHGAAATALAACVRCTSSGWPATRSTARSPPAWPAPWRGSPRSAIASKPASCRST